MFEQSHSPNHMRSVRNVHNDDLTSSRRFQVSLNFCLLVLCVAIKLGIYCNSIENKMRYGPGIDLMMETAGTKVSSIFI